MIDSRITKWVNASVNKYLAANSSSPLYIGGHDGPIPTDEMWAELFFSSGPNTEEKSSNDFHTTCTITVMCVVALTITNEYIIHELAGQFESFLSVDIPVMRLGPTDNGSLVGCLQPQNGIRKQQWGVIDRGTQGKARQISIEADFLMSYTLP